MDEETDESKSAAPKQSDVKQETAEKPAGWTRDQKIAVILGIVGIIVSVMVTIVGPALSAALFPAAPPSPTALAVDPTPAATGQPLSAALPPGTSRIVVAVFDGDDDDIAGTAIYDDLRSHAPSGVQVMRHKAVLDDQTARPFGETVSATLVIWGRYNRVYVQPYVERVRLNGTAAGADAQLEGGKLSLAVPQTATFEILTGQLVSQTSFLSFFGLGLDAVEAQAFTQAVTYLGQAIEANSTPGALNPSAAYFFRGNAYYAQGQYAAAVQDYARAVEFKPEDADAVYNHGVALQATGDEAGAIQRYDQVIELQPDYAEAFNNRGVIHRSRAEFDLAINDLDQAVRLKPQDATILTNRGNVYYSQGSFDRAIQDYDQAIQLQPGLAEAFNNRGGAYQNKGDHARAIQDYDKAIQLQPDYAEAYRNRGTAYISTGNYDRALQDFDQSLQLNPNDAASHAGRGLVHGMQANKNEAQKDFAKCIELSAGTPLQAACQQQLDGL